MPSDVIDIKIDFDNNKIYFMNSDRYVGIMKPTKLQLQEGVYYWGVNLSVGTEIQIDNSV